VASTPGGTPGISPARADSIRQPRGTLAGARDGSRLMLSRLAPETPALPRAHAARNHKLIFR